MFDIAQTPASTIRIPVAVINSGRPGPTLSITAGNHGTDYPRIEAAQRLYRATQPADIRGRIVMFPLVNVPGFEAVATNVNPIDNKNINHLFPGDPNGTISSVMAHRLVAEIAAVSEYHVDLHGGDATEWLRPFALVHTTGEAACDEVSERLAGAYDTGVIWITDPSSGHTSGMLPGALAERGIPAITADAGYLATCNEADVEMHLRGLRNVMKTIGMLDGEPELNFGQRQVVYRTHWQVNAQHAGVFAPLGQPDDLVEAGQLLGHVKNIQGDVIEELCAPVRGRIRTQLPRRVVTPGSPLFRGWTALDESS